MFTWICPQCGREVPPAYNECPDCTRAAAGPPAAAPPPPAPVEQAQPAPPPAWQPPPQQPVYAAPPPPAFAQPPQPAYAPPQQAYAPPQQAYAPPQQAYAPPQQAYAPPPEAPPGYQPFYAAPPPQPVPPPAQLRSWETPPPAPKGGLPTWLMAIVFALAFLGLGGGIYWLVGGARGGKGAAAPAAAVESPAAKPGAKTNPIQKFIEVSGVRFTEEGKKKVLSVRYLIINHSGAEITGLAGNVTVWGRTQKSEEDAAGTFSFQTALGPYESKELTSPLNTKLKIYELPDWQNVSTDIQITAPGAE